MTRSSGSKKYCIAIWILVLVAYIDATTPASLRRFLDIRDASKGLLAPRADGDGGVGMYCQSIQITWVDFLDSDCSDSNRK